MDELIWKENASQKFTVKSAYGVALGLLNKSPTAHSQAKSDGSFWKKIWKVNIPPKVRTLFWRACSNILPTRDNLQRRKVKIDPRGEICLQQPETTCRGRSGEHEISFISKELSYNLTTWGHCWGSYQHVDKVCSFWLIQVCK